ncbi:unnamed protein product, partial [Discosporangium mesarthrocarpum]
NVEEHVQAALSELRDHGFLTGDPTFHNTAMGTLMTVIFPCDSDHSHLILSRLESAGIGSDCGSVNVLPLEISRTCILHQRDRERERKKEKAQKEKEKEKAQKARCDAERACNSQTNQSAPGDSAASPAQDKGTTG